jgi:Carbohydrate family 9 binding domain-like
MAKKISLLLTCSLITVTGCANLSNRQASTMTAKYTIKPIKLDGRLNEPVWQTTTVYHLSLAKDQLDRKKKLAEPGEVRIAWDNDNIYLAVKFYDSDIKARGTKDQMHHYRLGDTVELFLKPEAQTWYWELYATPQNKKSTFWLPRHKKGLIIKELGLRVATYCEGTLNSSSNKDKFWTMEMAIPIKNLSSSEQPFDSGEKWRILVGRYNYKHHSRRPERSMTPQLSKTDYHRHQEYGILQLVK